MVAVALCVADIDACTNNACDNDATCADSAAPALGGRQGSAGAGVGVAPGADLTLALDEIQSRVGDVRLAIAHMVAGSPSGRATPKSPLANAFPPALPNHAAASPKSPRFYI